MYSERPALSFKKDMISIENGVNLERLRCALVGGNMSSILLRSRVWPSATQEGKDVDLMSG